MYALWRFSLGGNGPYPPHLGGTLPSKGSNSIFFFSLPRGIQANQARPISRNKGRYPGAAPGAPGTRRIPPLATTPRPRSEEHTSELQSLRHLVCRLLLEKKK